MTTPQGTTRSPIRMTADRINPLVDPESPVVTMARVAMVLNAMKEVLEPATERAELDWGFVLILECAVAALELAGEIGFPDGSLPELATVEGDGSR